MMVTPQNLNAFALGFTASEGLILDPSEILDLHIEEVTSGWQINLTTLNRTQQRVQQRRRKMAGPSGCGLCGIDSLEAAMDYPEPIAEKTQPPTHLAVEKAMTALAQQQRDHHRRGHHGAALFSIQGEYLFSSEDVGRHSALDKLLGQALENQTPIAHCGFALLTSRCSHDLVIKAARMKLPNLITIGQATDLAIASAERMNLGLYRYHQDTLKRLV